MNISMHRASSALVVSLALVGTVQASSPLTESGRWITQSGNLEVDIARCGIASCGTIVRVINHQAMDASPALMGMAATTATTSFRTKTAAAAAPPPSPLGKQILFDLLPLETGGVRGRIYNRADNKTYNSVLKTNEDGELELRIYEDTPVKVQVQIWRRPPASK